MAVKNTNIFDIIVVGGGPAGMMAAGRVAELGKKTVLIEKTYRLGSKLLLTGGGRCNITNDADTKDFIRAFGVNGKFLYRALSVFSNRDLIAFFKARGLEMRSDPDGKIFPADDSAESVLAVLRKYNEENNVRIIHNQAAVKILRSGQEGDEVRGIELAGGTVISAKNVIIATGGMSYPGTGSTGDGYELAKACGHSVIPLRPGLIPLESGEPFIKDLQGLVLQQVEISVISGAKKLSSEMGDLLFTHFGVSGPAVLMLSGAVVDALESGGEAELSVNLKPGYNTAEFERFLQKEMERSGKKTISGFLKDALPKSFAPIIETLSKIQADKRCNVINREERGRIAALFTDFRIKVSGTRPIDEATVTRGGISLDEIDPKTMESRIVKGLYFCGEIIDLDGVTGGYNLQEAFSTGYLAGESIGGK
ncbi:MAG: NAD(P)/FAD-dependent oxidoreductase [Elusimicrobiota bacterium]